MPVSDAIQKGAVALTSEYFAAPHLSDYFTSLDLPTVGANYETTGKWDDQHWLHNKNLEGGWADDIVVNKEAQKYVSQNDPAPDGWTPHELKPGGGLIIKARECPSTAAYDAWATGKRYDEKPGNGEDMFESDYGGRANIPGTENVDWRVESDGRVLWLRFPLTWQAGIINTGNGRAGLDQGEYKFIGKMPTGSVFVNDNDVKSQMCTFAAAWLIEQFYIGTGRNRQALAGGVTHYPFTGSHLINELDLVEHGGFDPFTNHNSRHVHDTSLFNLVSDGEAFYLEGLDLTNETFEARLHITYEKIGFAIGPAGGVVRYTRVIPTPTAFKRTMRTYELVSANSDQVVRDPVTNIPIETGEQLDIDGNPRTRQMMALCNLAMNGMWLRDRMRWERQTILNRGYAYPVFAVDGDGLRTAQMEVDHISMSHLIDAQFERLDGSFYEPYKQAGESFDMDLSPAHFAGMPALAVTMVPKNGTQIAGKIFDFVADRPEVTFRRMSGSTAAILVDGNLVAPEEGVPANITATLRE